MMNDLVATTLLKLDKTYPSCDKSLKKLGFKVTKNQANEFNYPFNHCFGTVSFIYQDEDKVVYLFN